MAARVGTAGALRTVWSVVALALFLAAGYAGYSGLMARIAGESASVQAAGSAEAPRDVAAWESALNTVWLPVLLCGLGVAALAVSLRYAAPALLEERGGENSGDGLSGVRRTHLGVES